MGLTVHMERSCMNMEVEREARTEEVNFGDTRMHLVLKALSLAQAMSQTQALSLSILSQAYILEKVYREKGV